MFVTDEILYKNLWRFHTFTDWFSTSNNGDKSVHIAKIDNGAHGGWGVAVAVAVKYQGRYTVRLGNYCIWQKASRVQAKLRSMHTMFGSRAERIP